MHALVRFAQIPAASAFSTAEVYPHAVTALGSTTEQYSLASLRYDLSNVQAGFCGGLGNGVIVRLAERPSVTLPGGT